MADFQEYAVLSEELADAKTEITGDIADVSTFIENSLGAGEVLIEDVLHTPVYDYSYTNTVLTPGYSVGATTYTDDDYTYYVHNSTYIRKINRTTGATVATTATTSYSVVRFICDDTYIYAFCRGTSSTSGSSYYSIVCKVFNKSTMALVKTSNTVNYSTGGFIGSDYYTPICQDDTYIYIATNGAYNSNTQYLGILRYTKTALVAGTITYTLLNITTSSYVTGNILFTIRDGYLYCSDSGDMVINIINLSTFTKVGSIDISTTAAGISTNSTIKYDTVPNGNNITTDGYFVVIYSYYSSTTYWFVNIVVFDLDGNPKSTYYVDEEYTEFPAFFYTVNNLTVIDNNVLLNYTTLQYIFKIDSVGRITYTGNYLTGLSSASGSGGYIHFVSDDRHVALVDQDLSLLLTSPSNPIFNGEYSAV